MCVCVCRHIYICTHTDTPIHRPFIDSIWLPQTMSWLAPTAGCTRQVIHTHHTLPLLMLQLVYLSGILAGRGRWHLGKVLPESFECVERSEWAPSNDSEEKHRVMQGLSTVSPRDFWKAETASGGRRSSRCSWGTLLAEPGMCLLVSGA